MEFKRSSGVYKISPLAPIPNQTTPVHTFPPHILRINLNIILPTTSRSSKWYLSFILLHQSSVCVLYTPSTLHS